MRPPTDAGYARFTDHAIPRFADSPASGGKDDLVPASGRPGDRETGLAWARIGNARHDEAALRRARDLLDRAYEQGASDGELLAVLAFLTDRAGDSSRAAQLYEQVLRTDPAQTEAVMNLGSSYATAGRLDDAVELWQDVARRNPGLESVWIKLASAYLVRGERARALDAAKTCLTYHPDSAGARDLIRAAEAERAK
jgi:Flp pilus assembly protein TadD